MDDGQVVDYASEDYLPNGIRGIVRFHNLQNQKVGSISAKSHILAFVDSEVQREVSLEHEGLLKRFSTEAKSERAVAIQNLWNELKKRCSMDPSLEQVTMKTLSKNISTRKSYQKLLKSNAQNPTTVITQPDSTSQSRITGLNESSPMP